MEKFRRALKAFNTELETAQQAEKAYILDMHYEVLSKVRIYLKEGHMGDAKLKRLHDEIFITKLDMPRSKTPTAVTKLYEEFIKGITYFKHQIDPSNPVPIYHRFFSCGIGNQVYNLICEANLTTTERKRRRALIERCYIERLIYDELYKQETLHFPIHGSNVEQGHIFRIDLTREDYESCFKGHGMEVEIKYDGNLPIRLIIKRYKNGSIIYEEEYSHEMRSTRSYIAPYTGFVVCKRQTKNGKVYYKTQDFSMEGDWKLGRQQT